MYVCVLSLCVKCLTHTQASKFQSVCKFYVNKCVEKENKIRKN